MNCTVKSILPLLLLLLAGVAWAAGPNKVPEPGTFPWRATTVTKLNLRSGPGTGYASKGIFDEGAFMIVDYRTTTGNWVKVSFTDKVQGPMEGYVEGTYLNYVSQVNPPDPKKTKTTFGSVLQAIWQAIKWILIIGVVLLALAFKEELIEIAVYIGIFVGIGALITYLLFHNGTAGAVIGFVLALFIALRDVIDLNSAGDFIKIVLMIVYCLASCTFYLLNQLQYFLSEPWRCVHKRHWGSESRNAFMRVFLEVLQVLLYIAITPLRLLNAIYYNIVVRGLVELYDFLFEVLSPSSAKEGADNFGRWLLFLPWRILKYPVFHGLLTLAESVAWTVVDIFIPAITLYHGTDLTAGQIITGSRKRNDRLYWELGRDSGTFRASKSNWGGIGVYFASRINVAKGYAWDRHRLSDNNPVTIVCRVSLGRIINYAIAPWWVYREAGEHGRHSTLNRYAEQHHYVTGEWWNDGGGYWEYCLFDWQDLYDERWRIRPLYLYNHRTKLIQHIKGGMSHWLFKI